MLRTNRKKNGLLMGVGAGSWGMALLKGEGVDGNWAYI